MSRGEVLAAAAVFAVAVIARVVAPEQFPSGVHVDEAAIGLVALDALHGRGPHPFAFAFIREPAPFVYAEAAALAFSGGDLAGARVLAGLAGALTVAVLWVLARDLFGPRVALVAAALLSLAAVHVHFSRLALNIVEIPLFGLLALAFAWRGLREGRPFWHAAAGFSLGVGQFGAFGSRSLILVLAGTYLAALAAHPRSWRAVVPGGLLAAVAAALVLLPQVVHVRDEPSLFWDRLENRSVFRRWEQATELHGTDDPAGVMLGQVATNLLAHVSLPDRGPFYGFAQEPLLFPPVGALYLLGLVLVLARARRPRYAMLALACGAALAGGVLSAGAPQFHRLVLGIPAACLVAALAADRVAGLAGCVCRRLAPGFAGWVPSVALGVLVVASGVDGLVSVFARHPSLHPWQPQTAWARWIAGQGDGRPVLVAGAPNIFSWDERLRFLARGVPHRDLPNPAVDLPAALAAGRPFVLALNPRLDDWLPLVRFLVPDVAPVVVEGPDGAPLLLKFDVSRPRAARAAEHGLRGELTIEDGDRASIPLDAPALAFRETSKLAHGRPFRARWTGDLRVPRDGEYRVEVYTEGGVEVRLGGRAVIEGRPAPEPRSLRTDLHLKAGAKPLEVSYTYVRGPGTLELRWRPPGEDRSLIPPEALRPQ